MNELLVTAIIAAAVAVFVTAGALTLALGWVKGSDRARRRALEALHGDVRGLTAGAAGMGKRVVRLEQGVRTLTERLDHLELRDNGTRPYAQAIRLVEQGAGIGELVHTCGLTEGEAELVVMLHGAGTRAATGTGD